MDECPVKIFLQVNSLIKVQLYPSYWPYRNLMTNRLKFKHDMLGFTSLCVALYLLSDLAARISLSSSRNSTGTLKSYGWNHTRYDTEHYCKASQHYSPVVDQANHVFKKLDTCQEATFGTSWRTWYQI